MTWITAHHTTYSGDIVATVINTEHIARVRRTKEGKAMIMWAIAGRDALTLTEPYDYIISKLP